jgi:hypothetical protein
MFRLAKHKFGRRYMGFAHQDVCGLKREKDGFIRWIRILLVYIFVE